MDSHGRTIQATVTSPTAGLVRAALAVLIALCLSRGGWSTSEALGAYLAVGLATIFGGLLIVGRPKIIAREGLARTAADTVLVSTLVADTGGGGSPFFPLYFLVALQAAWIGFRTGATVAAALVVGGYLIAAVVSGDLETLGSAAVGLRAGLLALAGVIVVYLGNEIHAARKRTLDLTSVLTAERTRAEKADVLVQRFGPALKMLSLEAALQWAAEAAQTVVGGSYAHVASLKGTHHRTVLTGEFHACPSWWHPSVQRLVLWSCRERDTVRHEGAIHGIEGLMAVPVGVGSNDQWGAIVVGGRVYGAEEERALERLAEGLAPALERSDDALGGLDEPSGLPNRESLHRALRRDLSQGKALAVLAIGLDRHRDGPDGRSTAVRDTLLRRVGERLESGWRRAFRHGDDVFVVLLGSSDEGVAGAAALAIRRLVSVELSGIGLLHTDVAVGFALAKSGSEASTLLLEAALRALGSAKANEEKIFGFPTGNGASKLLESNARSASVIEALMEAMEARDPYLREHAERVSRIARLIGREMLLDRQQIDAVVTGALLHDVGKIGIPDVILHKPGTLNDEEYETVKRHPIFGAEIVGPLIELAPALPVIRHHHERFDGRGYPDGLRGEGIPLAARVVSVADAFDSMVRDRPYGRGVRTGVALEELRANAGTQFDPQIVEVLLRLIGEIDDSRTGSAS